MEYKRDGDRATVTMDDGHKYAWIVTKEDLDERYYYILPKDREFHLEMALIEQTKRNHERLKKIRENKE